METSDDHLYFSHCSVKLIKENSEVKVFPVIKENEVEFFALEQKMSQFPEDFISDLDQILLHFCGLLIKVKKTEVEGIFPLVELLIEKIREIVFNCGINKDNLASILKTKFVDMHSHYDREHSSVLIELRNSLIEKCKMPKEIRRYLITTRTIDEANSRFQERVLMMKTYKINEIQAIFENVYEGFIADPSQIHHEFTTYNQIMKEKKISIFTGWKSDIKNYLKNIIIQSRYSWIVIKKCCIKKHIRKVPKIFKINLGTTDAILASAGLVEVTQCLDVDSGVCLVISSKPENVESNSQIATSEKSLIVYYVNNKREVIQDFSEGSVKIASGSSRNYFIVLQQFRKVSKMVQHRGKFVETERFELGLDTFQEINQIACNSVTETIIFTTNDNSLFTFTKGVLVKLNDSVIYCLRFVSSFSSLVIVSNENISVFDNGMNPVVNIGLDKVNELGIFNQGQPDLSHFGISYTKNRIFLCNFRENSILYLKVEMESNLFTPRARKSLIKVILEEAGNLSPTIKDWFKNNQGFDKIDITPGLDVYLSHSKPSIEDSNPNEQKFN